MAEALEIARVGISILAVLADRDDEVRLPLAVLAGISILAVLADRDGGVAQR